MILLFNPAPPQLECCLVSDRDGAAASHMVDMEGDWPAVIMECLPPDDRLDAIGYVLHNGGDRITQSVCLLSPDMIERMQETVPLLPEHNETTLEVSKLWMSRRPDVAHVLFCDTAFFTSLPPAVRDYALPYEATQRGLHRYGGFGLCHERMWRQTQALTGGRARKVVSVYLGDRCNLAAIQDGSPVETTIGLTYLEGIMSSRGCGDIDPTIIFQLGAAGLSYSAITRMLSTQSGFTALAGRPCDLADVLRGSSDAGLAAARRLLTYQIVKYVGAFLASLGGADTLIFVGDHPSEVMPLVRDLCDALTFLGVRCQWDAGPAQFPREISTEDSALRVLISGYNVWEAMSEQARAVINKGKELAG